MPEISWMALSSSSMTYGIWIRCWCFLTCHFYVYTVSHELNLVWAQKDIHFSEVARVVGVNGDPNNWVPNRTATTRYITAPNNHWHFVALSYLYSQKTLFWSDRGNKKIQGLQLGGSNVAYSVFGGISSQVEGLVVDWLAETIYWTDALYNWIMVAPAKRHSSIYRIIVDTGLDNPMGIALHPYRGYLFWSDWGVQPKIERSSLSGEDRTILVSAELSKPMGLTLDFAEGRLYWVDRDRDSVASVDLNGRNRALIFTVPNTKFFDLALYQDYLFITDQDKGQLYVFNRRRKKHEVNFNLGTNPYGIVMYDPAQQQTRAMPCRSLGCKHLCVSDYDGRAKCLCTTGYELLPDGKTCVEDGRYSTPLFIYSIGAALCRFPGNLADMSLQNVSLDTQCFLTHRRNALALSFNVYEQMLYFAENKSRTISRVHLQEGQSPEVIIGGTGQVEGLAVDWISSNIYWTDTTYKQIWVSRTTGRHQKIIVDSRLDAPRGIAVDPIGRHIYWTDVGQNPIIEKSDLDGTHRAVIVDTNLGSPNHIIIDYKTKRLFWSDSKMDRIESIGLTGNDRSVVMEKTGSDAYGLSVFQDFLVWTDRDKRNGIHVGLKDTGQKIRGIVHPGIGIAYDVITYDYSAQPLMESFCDDLNGGCEQLCLPGQHKSQGVCACALGLDFNPITRHCEGEIVNDNFLLFTDTYQKQIFQMNLRDFSISAIPLSLHDNPISLDYHPTQEKFYWTDVATKVIKRAFLNGSQEETLLILSNASIPDGIALDVISNLVYYTDTGENHIAVLSMTGNYHKILIKDNVDQPRAIALDPRKGLMFWTDWGSDARIERANMDGNGRTTIVNSGIGWPNGLEIDSAEGMLYWADAKSDKIESCDFNGLRRRVLKTETGAHFFGLTVLDRYIFYTDWTKKTVMRMLKADGSFNTSVGPAVFSRINDIHSFSKFVFEKGKLSNACSVNNGGCTHLCIPVPEGNVCSCPEVVHTRMRSVQTPCSVRKMDVVSDVKLEAPLSSSSTFMNRTAPLSTTRGNTSPTNGQGLVNVSITKSATHPPTPESTINMHSQTETTSHFQSTQPSSTPLPAQPNKITVGTSELTTVRTSTSKPSTVTTVLSTTSTLTSSTQTFPEKKLAPKSYLSSSSKHLGTTKQTSRQENHTQNRKNQKTISSITSTSVTTESVPPQRDNTWTINTEITSKPILGVKYTTLVKTANPTKETTAKGSTKVTLNSGISSTTKLTSVEVTRSVSKSTTTNAARTLWVFPNDPEIIVTSTQTPIASSPPSTTEYSIAIKPKIEIGQIKSKEMLGIPLYGFILIIVGAVIFLTFFVVVGIFIFKKSNVNPTRHRSVSIEHSTSTNHQRAPWNDSFEIPLQDTLSPDNRTNACTNYITFHDNYYTGDVDSGIENPAFVRKDRIEPERSSNGFLAGKQFSTFRHIQPISPC